MDVYTDGSSQGNLCGWAYEADGVIESGGFRGTNNEAECWAILQAMVDAPANTHLRIHSDSKFAIAICSRRWKSDIPWYKNLVDGIQGLIYSKDLSVQFVKVKSHTGVDRNERVDRLAKAEVAKMRETP